ncbi:hypothetical protein Z959_13325 [Clostridium novyi B str. ATCC 27606]|uniref:Peptidase S1 domain-containing protein n=2 Tax=Clostridium TaxID=1485 RepID=A0AA40IS44_CLONO|nr:MULTISPECIES: hypothetical protein [Clostridium]KEI08420.1 hypothetical protein Z958_13040 [Clostridium novyi B str. NCTC 9691]KEI11678.1 hypothetical protein Z959_13325 [Clostridium novyi B str. ATCC 27606]KEI14327.1 hypothetical protein Z960_12620 [Clostridium haemolyticum NCTC 9693]KGM98628.1 hypothetical protein Z961_12490 [Clostridium haemolyticum NCTC 8350]OOB76426.1 hypothetical protein AXF41_12270 [Clostridium haemolyticum]
MYYCEENKMEKIISNICNDEYEYFLNKANVVGVGCGYKVKNGFYTNQLCIQVFTRIKLPSKQLNSWDLIPNLYKGIPTDVIQTGVFTSCSLSRRIRPTLGGYVIGNDYIDEISGTLGCLVTDNTDLFILSNNHVIAMDNEAPLGTKIIQPSCNWGGSFKTDVIAILFKYIPIKFIGTIKTPTNYVDCAIAKVINKSLVSSQIAFVGLPAGTIIPRLNENVKKVGYKTELTTGIIKSIHCTVVTEFDDNGKKAMFKEQIFTTRIGEIGDSGAILLDKNNNVIGLLMSNADTHSTFNPINTILKELKVQLVTSEL